MAWRGGNGKPGSGMLEGPYDLFGSVTTTATATSHTTADFVACKGARAVYLVVYSKSGGTTALNNGNPRGYIKAGLAQSGTAAGLGVVYGQAGTVNMNLGGIYCYTPIAAHGVISCEFLGAQIVTAAGVAQNDVACEAYVYW